MPTASACHRSFMPVACFVMCACAIVSACDNVHDDTTPAPSAKASVSETSQSIQSNELRDWARQATIGGQSDTHVAAINQTFDALALP